MKKDALKKKTKRKKMTFSFDSSGAVEVFLAGEFNRWDPKKHPMKHDGNGSWKKSVILLPGDYEYKFLVDGKWEEDRQNSRNCSNAFGTLNNVVSVNL